MSLRKFSRASKIWVSRACPQTSHLSNPPRRSAVVYAQKTYPLRMKPGASNKREKQTQTPQKHGLSSSSKHHLPQFGSLRHNHQRGHGAQTPVLLHTGHYLRVRPTLPKTRLHHTAVNRSQLARIDKGSEA